MESSGPVLSRRWTGRRAIAIGDSAALAIVAVPACSGTSKAIAAATLAGDSCKDLPIHGQPQSAMAHVPITTSPGARATPWGSTIWRLG